MSAAPIEHHCTVAIMDTPTPSGQTRGFRKPITAARYSHLLAKPGYPRFVNEGRQSCHQLRLRKRLLKQHASRHPLGPPVLSAVPGHVNYGQQWLQLPRSTSRIPSVCLSGRPYVSKQGAESGRILFQSVYGLLCGGDGEKGETCIAHDLFEVYAYQRLVFCNKNERRGAFQVCIPLSLDRIITRFARIRWMVLVRSLDTSGPGRGSLTIKPLHWRIVPRSPSLARGIPAPQAREGLE